MLPEPVAVEKVLLFRKTVLLSMEKKDEKEIIKEFTEKGYKYGFVSNLDSDTISKGLNEDVIRLISKKKQEPTWMLQKRLAAFKILQDMNPPKWAKLKFKEIDLQKISLGHIVFFYSLFYKYNPNSLGNSSCKLSRYSFRGRS